MQEIINVGVKADNILYNSYLIKGEKNVLIDTLPVQYADVLIDNIKKYVPIEELDYIIINHTESDRSGCLKELLLQNEDVCICATLAGLNNIEQQLNCKFNSLLIKNNSILEIGHDVSLSFIITHNINWPDSMMTFFDNEKILFSCDAFSEYKEDGLFEYYNSHLSHLNEYVYTAVKKLKEIDIKAVYPANGGIITDVTTVLNQYENWSMPVITDKKSIALVYSSNTGNTGCMAEYALEFFKAKEDIDFYMLNADKEKTSDILDVIYKSDGVIFASPTVNRSVTKSVSDILMSMNHYKIKNKSFCAYGSYGWSGEAPGLIYSILRARHFEVFSKPFRYMFVPNKETYDDFKIYLNDFYKKVTID